jgi:hypothetical protein
MYVISTIWDGVFYKQKKPFSFFFIASPAGRFFLATRTKKKPKNPSSPSGEYYVGNCIIYKYVAFSTYFSRCFRDGDIQNVSFYYKKNPLTTSRLFYTLKYLFTIYLYTLHPQLSTFHLSTFPFLFKYS